ncbi:MAG: hypothetical protein JW870_10320, partial [Candidatus Delongbacteria bacterium]|nr:hypothetical protein [Candidatus Delongbacteria bacterium]
KNSKNHPISCSPLGEMSANWRTEGEKPQAQTKPLSGPMTTDREKSRVRVRFESEIPPNPLKGALTA